MPEDVKNKVAPIDIDLLKAEIKLLKSEVEELTTDVTAIMERVIDFNRRSAHKL